MKIQYSSVPVQPPEISEILDLRIVRADCRLVFVSEKKEKSRVRSQAPIGVCGVVGIVMLQALRKLRLLFR